MNVNIFVVNIFCASKDKPLRNQFYYLHVYPDSIRRVFDGCHHEEHLQFCQRHNPPGKLVPEPRANDAN